MSPAGTRGAVDPSGSAVPRESLPPAASTVATACAAVLGIVLVTLQYLGRLSLHTDEAAIALNLRDKPLGALLSQPLDYAQMAPPAWLATEWLALRLLGPTEFALRLLPFVASLAALVLTALVARRVAGGIAPALTVLWLATSWEFRFYGTQLKQYGSDVAVVMLLTLLALRTLDDDARARWSAGVLGGVAILFSQAGAFAAAGIGAVLTVQALVTGGWRRTLQLTPLLLPWAIAAAGVAAWTVALTPPALAAYMDKFWEFTFARWPLRPGRVARWLWESLRRAAFDPMAAEWPRHLPKLYGALFALGVATFAWRATRRAALLLVPLAIAIALAMAHRYPFGGRVTLYLLPVLFLGTALGAERLAAWVMRGRRAATPSRGGVTLASALASAFACMLAFPVLRVQALYPPPNWIDNSRAQVEALATAVRAGDEVFVHHSIAKPFDWYWAIAPHENVPLIRGRCYNGDPRPYLAQVDSLRGHPRVWIATTDTSWNHYPFVSRYVETIAPVRDSVVATDAPRAQREARQVAYLRSFSDSAALAAARRDTITIPPAWIIDWAGWTCFGSEATPVIHPSLWR